MFFPLIYEGKNSPPIDLEVKLRTLEISEAEASALVKVAGRISAIDTSVNTVTSISDTAVPAEESVIESVSAIADVDNIVVVPVSSASSMPTFASSVPSVQEVLEATPSLAKVSPSATKASAKAERKAANQAINARINAQLANATKAHDAGDPARVAEALNTAMQLVPTRTNKDGSLTWRSTVERIIAKAESLDAVKA